METHIFAPIVKAEKQADGTMLVSGPVSTSALDRDEQVCNEAWLDAAVPKWFGESGNIREMHSKIAAGKALTYWKGETGDHWVQALVVDPASVSKVDHKVLTGFSIGIKGARVVKSTRARNGEIVDGSIVEVSLVDRPANPECLLTLAKSDSAGVMLPVEEQSLVEAEYVDVTDPASASAPMTEAVSEVRARANDVLAALTSLNLATLATVKDDATDVASAEQAIGIIARLIQSEAESLAAGKQEDLYDIRLLLGAVDALRYFIASEQTDAPVQLADEPEPVPAQPVEEKSDDTPAATVTEAVEPVIVEATKTDEPSDGTLAKADTLTFEGVQAMIAEALAKADETHKAETESLRVELAKVKAQPIPGGPVRVRTSIDTTKALEADRTNLLKQAASYDSKADESDDRGVADGYRILAQRAREAAAR